MILIVLLSLSIAAYLSFAWISALALSRGLRAAAPGADLPAVAVVVAARDEENHIEACLQALIRQDYPADRMQIIVSDDHSVDGTARVVQGMAQRDRRVVIVDAASAGAGCGKGEALALGIDATTSAIVATTDADCTPPRGWLRSMVLTLLADGRAGLGGPTLVASETPFGRVQALDWLLGFSMAGASSILGHPLTAMGNNMIFRRRDYDAVGGYRRFASSPTEDYALFRALAGRPGGVSVALSPQHVTHTRPVSSVREAFSQRRRWARGGLQGPLWTKAIFAAVWLASLLPILLVPFFPLLALSAMSLKVAADALVLRFGASRVGLRSRPAAFFAFEAYLVGYTALLPISLVLAPKLTWKGRRI